MFHLGQNNPKQTGLQHKTAWYWGKSDIRHFRGPGILLDGKLKFFKHVEEHVNKANRILGLIRGSYQCLDRESMKMLFTALVWPHLEFGNAFWVPCFQKDRLLIRGVQRCATKLVPGLKDLDYSEGLKSVDLPSMKYCRESEDMIETYIYGLYSVNNCLLKMDVETVMRTQI